VRGILLSAAREAALRAYAPYSNFRVGAALVVVTPDGPHIVTGANVENASFGVTLCAERNALAAACAAYSIPSQHPQKSRSAQKPMITHVAVACIDASPDAPAVQKTPCGACRQWFAELASEAVFYVDGMNKDLRLDDLLPLAFRLDS
jgi:cytidine deaminase